MKYTIKDLFKGYWRKKYKYLPKDLYKEIFEGPDTLGEKDYQQFLEGFFHCD